MSPEGGDRARVRRVPFEMPSSDGGVLRGDVRFPGAPANLTAAGGGTTAIVVCHGFKGFKDWGFFPYLAETLAMETGATVVSFNFSGSGIGADLENFTDLEGFAHNTFSREVRDLEAILDGLRAGRLGGVTLVPPTRVGVIGHSRGAASAVLVGARRAEVEAVVTWAGIGSVFRYEDWFDECLGDGDVMEIVNARTGQRLPLYRDVLTDLRAHRDELDMAGAARQLGSRLLIVHGTADEAVPVVEAHALHKASEGGVLAILEGAGHTMDAVHPFPGTNPRLEQALRRSADHFGRYLAEEDA